MKIGGNGREFCPKCGRQTIEADLPKPHGYCSACQWFTFAVNESHNKTMISLTASLKMLDSLIDSAKEDKRAGRETRPNTREIAGSLVAHLKRQ